jgi:hypothetical protein
MPCNTILTSTLNAMQQTVTVRSHSSQPLLINPLIRSDLTSLPRKKGTLHNQRKSVPQIQPPEPPRWHSVVVNTLQVEQRVHSPSERMTLSV